MASGPLAEMTQSNNIKVQGLLDKAASAQRAGHAATAEEFVSAVFFRLMNETHLRITAWEFFALRPVATKSR